jgi:putative pyruvate formate lyase activating enzyme
MISKAALIRSRLKPAYRLLSPCRVCPRACGIDRLAGETGFCGMGFHPVVASDNLHFGEEPPISGTRGSGTIFFGGCSLGCSFCQNYPISHLRHGNQVTIPELAGMMLKLQKRGAHNINFVTPTHFSPQILGALAIACSKGLTIPLVWNSSGYETVEMLELLNGIVDVYMPDMKFADSEPAERIAGAGNYPEINREAILEMHRQVGPLELDEEGIANKGLLIRHLVLPENLSGTDDVLRFIAEKVSRRTSISLMSQFFPAHQSHEKPPLDRPVTAGEYERAKESLERYGLTEGWVQEE